MDVLNIAFKVLETVSVAALLGGIALIKNEFKDHKKAHSILEKANLDQIRDKLLDKYKEGKARGVVSLHDKEVFNKLYESYIMLGGNSFMEQLKDKYDDFNETCDD